MKRKLGRRTNSRTDTQEVHGMQDEEYLMKGVGKEGQCEQCVHKKRGRKKSPSALMFLRSPSMPPTTHHCYQPPTPTPNPVNITRHQGESYLDVIERLEPLVHEIERHKESLLIVGHQVVVGLFVVVVVVGLHCFYCDSLKDSCCGLHGLSGFHYDCCLGGGANTLP